MGHDRRSSYVCSVSIILQFVMVYIVRDVGFAYLVLLTYIVSGTLNHSLFLAMHEASHDLMFESSLANRVFSHIINLPMGVPASAYFRVYHKSHHTDLGDPSEDTDIPTRIETQLFKGKIGRLVWLCSQSIIYVIRPIIVKPLPLTRHILISSCVQYLFDIFVMYFLGWRALFYLIVGSVLGGSLHPMSGHFIAEHFEFVPGQATYSYYGPLNRIGYNVGYHVEHHDFPNIPCSRLPRLREIASEWYDLPSYGSWIEVLFKFVFDKHITLSARFRQRKT